MGDDDSGGLSANKVVSQEEEGNTAPFPEKVSALFVATEMLFDFLN